MTDIVTDRLILRPITAEDVRAVVSGQRQSGWARPRPGYATEAVQAMVADILPPDGIQTVTANVEFDNLASIRVLHKCGMTLCAQNQHLPYSLPPTRFHLIQAWPDRPGEMSLS
jgi:Acetyltransferase (GNAT) domain